VTPPAVIFEADASSRFHGRPRRQKVYPFPSPPGLGSPSPVQAPRFRFLGGVFPRQVLSLPQERASVSSFWFWSRRVVLRFDFAIACHQGRSFPARVAHSPSQIFSRPGFCSHENFVLCASFFGQASCSRSPIWPRASFQQLTPPLVL
jgi:hypothetical protein